MSSIKQKINKSINSNKTLKQFNTKIEKTVGYSTQHIIIGFITVVVAIYVCMKLYNWYSYGFTFSLGGDNSGSGNGSGNSSESGSGNNNEIVNYSKSGNVPTMKRPYLNLYAVMKDVYYS